MKRFPFPLIWLPVAAMLGWLGCAVPWGSPTGFHGTGLPLPGVMWDKPKGYDHFIDYPNPLCVIENPLFFYLIGITVWGVYRGIRFLFTRYA